jgi:hypothetical protein
MKLARLTAVAVLLATVPPAIAQTNASGGAGASNAAAASPGGIPPSTPGTAAGSTSPGGINGHPEAPRSPPANLNPNQVPNTGPLVNSTRPTSSPSPIVSGSRGERGTVGSSAPKQSQREMDKALDDSTNRKVKDICKGC